MSRGSWPLCSYTIALPDGRIQTTTYTADHTHGFVAEVTYSGEAVYPPEPSGGYGHAAPAPGYGPGRKETRICEDVLMFPHCEDDTSWYLLH